MIQPGLLEIGESTNQHDATRLHKEHKYDVRIFRDSINVQKGLTKQIVQAIDPKYLKWLCGCTTNTITTNIQNFLAHLMRCYSVVEVDTLSKQEQKVRDIQYNNLDLLVTMYAEVKEQERLGIAAGNPYSTTQIITFAVHEIWNTCDFEEGMKS